MKSCHVKKGWFSAGKAPQLEGRTPISTMFIDKRLRVEGLALVPSLFPESFSPRAFSANGNRKTADQRLMSRTDTKTSN